MTRDPGRVVGWFPLVPRSRPPGRPLAERVAEVVETAEALRAQAEHGEVAEVARVFNRAALIASDTGNNEMAWRWCWRHATLFLNCVPLDAPIARLALEPLVNLARLRIRTGHGMAAYQLIDTLHRAVDQGECAEVDGRQLRLDRLTSTPTQREQVAQWLWKVRLGDGLRALTSAGAWTQATTQAERHRGIGQRLLDGRQIAIIARSLGGDTDTALAMVQASAVSEPWEHAVQSCLETLGRTTANLPSIPAAERMTRYFFTLASTDTPIVFRTRLGLAVLDLAENAGFACANEVLARLVGDTVRVGDSYAARDIRTNHLSVLTPEQKAQLDASIASSGLHTEDALALYLPQLGVALDTAEETIRRIHAGRELPKSD